MSTIYAELNQLISIEDLQRQLASLQQAPAKQQHVAELKTAAGNRAERANAAQTKQLLDLRRETKVDKEQIFVLEQRIASYERIVQRLNASQQETQECQNKQTEIEARQRVVEQKLSACLKQQPRLLDEEKQEAEQRGYQRGKQEQDVELGRREQQIQELTREVKQEAETTQTIFENIQNAFNRFVISVNQDNTLLTPYVQAPDAFSLFSTNYHLSG